MCRTSLKPALRASVSISVGEKKLMKGVPFARAPAAARSIAGRNSASAISIGSMNDIANVEPAVSDATWRNVAAIASVVEYMLTPVDAMTAGRPESKPDFINRCHHASPLSKSTGTNRRNDGMPNPSSTRRRRDEPGTRHNGMQRSPQRGADSCIVGLCQQLITHNVSLY